MFYFRNQFSNDDLKKIDEQLIDFFNEEKVNEIISYGKSKKCCEIDVKIFLNPDETEQCRLYEEIKFIVINQNIEAIENEPTHHDKFLVLLASTNLKLSPLMFKERKKWIKKLTFQQHIDNIATNHPDLDAYSYFYISRFLSTKEKRLHQLDYRKEKTDYIHFLFVLSED